MRSHTLLALSALLAAWGSAAQAADGPSYSFSGFGTLGAVHSSEKNADFTSLANLPNGAGHTRNPDFNVDSRLGGQVDVKFNPDLSATAQVVALQRVGNDYGPEVMLAFGKWQATPTVAVRGGRMALPMFVTSDYRLAAYSLPFVRPPVDMYHIASVYHYDGADATWSTQINNDLTLKTQFFTGSADAPTPDVRIKPRRLTGLNLMAEHDVTSYRISYVLFGDLSITSPALDTGFQLVRFGAPAGALGPGAPALPASPALADQYEIRDSTAKYLAFGFIHDPGEWFINAEAAHVGTFGFFPNFKMGYLTLGLRRGDLTPYTTWSTYQLKPAPLSGHPIIDNIVANSANGSRKTLAAGLRWDFRKNMDLKLQFDHVTPDANSSGSLRNFQTGYQMGSTYNVLSATLDFVF